MITLESNYSNISKKEKTKKYLDDLANQINSNKIIKDIKKEKEFQKDSQQFEVLQKLKHEEKLKLKKISDFKNKLLMENMKIKEEKDIERNVKLLYLI